MPRLLLISAGVVGVGAVGAAGMGRGAVEAEGLLDEEAPPVPGPRGHSVVDSQPLAPLPSQSKKAEAPEGKSQLNRKRRIGARTLAGTFAEVAHPAEHTGA